MSQRPGVHLYITWADVHLLQRHEAPDNSCDSLTVPHGSDSVTMNQLLWGNLQHHQVSGEESEMWQLTLKQHRVFSMSHSLQLCKESGRCCHLVLMNQTTSSRFLWVCWDAAKKSDEQWNRTRSWRQIAAALIRNDSCLKSGETKSVVLVPLRILLSS